MILAVGEIHYPVGERIYQHQDDIDSKGQTEQHLCSHIVSHINIPGARNQTDKDRIGRQYQCVDDVVAVGSRYPDPVGCSAKGFKRNDREHIHHCTGKGYYDQRKKHFICAAFEKLSDYHRENDDAQHQKSADIKLVSEMDDDFVRSIFMEPCSSLEQAFEEALQKQGKDASVIVMPYGGSTLPVLRGKE